MQLAKMLTHAKPVFEYIDVPTFIAQGVKDKVIPAESSVAFLMDTIQSQKELLFLKESGHYICEDSESELLFESLLRFLQKEKDLL
ncbi:putative carboxylesterase [Listeria fleischmannii FSL S10-1203]|uniref:Putative carboxylesterase n=1 Tax=Listeria fleischmannii FSL S10-1203 TaxID=1265822 RepID=W7DJI7_9LIST|nr:putative carboxylesterase [Listeria fleischmannii FSL S10-1203]